MDKRNRKTNEITTYTGKYMDPTDPHMEDFEIKDIAHALSLICRGNGQVKTFFSVGQHCINCCKEAAARGYSTRLQLACLLHDAGECYLSDVPRPFKQNMPMYIQMEDKLLDLIYEKFLGASLDAEEQKLLKQVDNAMLYYDMKELLGELVATEAPSIGIELSYEFVPFHVTEQNYLELFHELHSQL